MKSEAQLQFECVKWFNNTCKDYRGCLVEINNNTNKGAYRKSLGQVKYASDLVFYDHISGRVLFIEMKLDGSTHKVDHLTGQLKWLRKMDEGFFSTFCFSLEMFQDLIHMTVNGDVDGLVSLSYRALNFIETKIIDAQSRGVKSVKLNYHGK